MNWLRLTGELAVNLNHIRSVTVTGMEGHPYVPTVNLRGEEGLRSISIEDLTDEGRDWLKALGLLT